MPYVKNLIEMNAQVAEFDLYLSEGGMWSEELQEIRNDRAELEKCFIDLIPTTPKFETNASNVCAMMTLHSKLKTLLRFGKPLRLRNFAKQTCHQLRSERSKW